MGRECHGTSGSYAELEMASAAQLVPNRLKTSVPLENTFHPTNFGRYHQIMKLKDASFLEHHKSSTNQKPGSAEDKPHLLGRIQLCMYV